MSYIYGFNITNYFIVLGVATLHAVIETTETNYDSLNRTGVEPTVYHTRGDHTNHYTKITKTTWLIYSHCKLSFVGKDHRYSFTSTVVLNPLVYVHVLKSYVKVTSMCYMVGRVLKYVNRFLNLN